MSVGCKEKTAWPYLQDLDLCCSLVVTLVDFALPISGRNCDFNHVYTFVVNRCKYIYMKETERTLRLP